jgi:hypothetical protein
MVRLFRRGRIFWVESIREGKRQRWSLKTTDESVAKGLAQRIQIEQQKALFKSRLFGLAAKVAESLLAMSDATADSLPMSYLGCRTREREIVLQRTYNLSFSGLDALVRKQHGLCLLCLKPLGADACVDHLHLDDMNPVLVRGILHNSCNMMLGAIEANGPEWTERALVYLGWDAQKLTDR